MFIFLLTFWLYHPHSSYTYTLSLHSLSSSLCVLFFPLNNALTPICMTYILLGVEPSTTTCQGHTFEENGSPSASGHQLSIVSELGLGILSTFPIHAGMLTDWLDLIQVLYRKPQLLRVHAHSGHAYPKDTASLQSSWPLSAMDPGPLGKRAWWRRPICDWTLHRHNKAYWLFWKK